MEEYRPLRHALLTTVRINEDIHRQRHATVPQCTALVWNFDVVSYCCCVYYLECHHPSRLPLVGSSTGTRAESQDLTYLLGPRDTSAGTNRNEGRRMMPHSIQSLSHHSWAIQRKTTNLNVRKKAVKARKRRCSKLYEQQPYSSTIHETV